MSAAEPRYHIQVDSFRRHLTGHLTRIVFCFSVSSTTTHFSVLYKSLVSPSAKHGSALYGMGIWANSNSLESLHMSSPVLTILHILASLRCQFVVIELLLAKIAVDQNTFCCAKPSQKHLEGTCISGRKKWMSFNGLLTVWFIKSQKKPKGYGFKRVQLLRAASSSG